MRRPCAAGGATAVALGVAIAVAGCAGGAAMREDGWRSDHSGPPPLGPTFVVTSHDPAPLVFTRPGRGGAHVRYVFHRETSPTDRALRAVVIDRGFAYAVGDGGIAVRRTAQGRWRVEQTGTDATLRGLAVATWQGAAYASYPADPRAVPVYAVGDGGTIVRRGADGRWTRQASTTDATLRGVAATAAELVAVGDRGTILWLHQGSWHAVASHTHATLRAVALSPQAAVAVGDGGVIVECVFRSTLACVPRPSPTSHDLGWISERTVRWDSGGISGFTIHELEAFARDGGRLTRAEWYPIRFARASRAPFPVRGYAAQHWLWDVAAPEDLAVGDGGRIALVDPYRAWVPASSKPAAERVTPALASRDRAEPHAFRVKRLPEGTDLAAVAFEGLDGFAVGDRGAILQLTVEGAHIPVAEPL